MKRLIVKFPDGHTNLPVSHIEREECVVFAYKDAELIGVFDLGAVDALYVSERSVTGPEV